MSGYSGTPLAKKLGLKEGLRYYPSGAPEHLLTLLAPLPDGLQIEQSFSAKTDVAHLFTASRAELEKLLRAWRPKLQPAGVVWISWPKKTSKVPTDITEETIRSVCLPLGYVDIKVCAIDEVWSGLKLMIRKELR